MARYCYENTRKMCCCEGFSVVDNLLITQIPHLRKSLAAPNKTDTFPPSLFRLGHSRKLQLLTSQQQRSYASSRRILIKSKWSPEYHINNFAKTPQINITSERNRSLVDNS